MIIFLFLRIKWNHSVSLPKQTIPAFKKNLLSSMSGAPATQSEQSCKSKLLDTLSFHFFVFSVYNERAGKSP